MAKIEWKKIKLLVVDLDNTLCDTFHTLSKVQWLKVEKALINEGYPFCAEEMSDNFGKHGFINTIKKIKLPREAFKIAVKAYDDVDISNLKLFKDAGHILNLKFPKVLVSRGEESLQRKKIRHLGIRKKFKKIYIVDTFGDKEITFKKILKEFKLKPEEALIIGDRLREEIAAGKRLGCPTILIKRPDWPIGTSRCKPNLIVKNLSTISKHFSNR